MPILHIEAFLIAITILTMTPGLDTTLVIRNTSRGGEKDGFITSLGICTGLFFHASLSAVGISLLLSQSPQLFQAVKMIGALYILYLGVQGLRHSFFASTKGPAKLSAQGNFKFTKSFREGLLSNVLNPKTAIFYLAFLPQFINPEYSAFMQSLLMATIHFAIAMCWQAFISRMIVTAQKRFDGGKTQVIMERLTGVVLIGLAVKLLLEK
ncbi:MULTISPECIES: LysE family translocator [Psychromonas]|uniref:LysE family translocator n=1 Tax=Psychromonas TaxID=67572 RepID=UPI000407BC55|nr:MULTISPECIES: LysE family translocator [Psychromonas]MBB1271916.1 LysE family translocator [Psychromonas sp. SR45-3]